MWKYKVRSKVTFPKSDLETDLLEDSFSGISSSHTDAEYSEAPNSSRPARCQEFMLLLASKDPVTCILNGTFYLLTGSKIARFLTKFSH